ncbi:glycosyl transferase [Campylobacter sp. FMV-PI01]|uniref:Glycosyl transferase n=1 Tax=Campylobacter portucalensis TaxID=2608384 RepID=A0A6L5WI11_9BACT|nr:glycosyltransferase [Campylobacter portucalensis]MSN96546.1 glycosyl transferase [Campylobacter portucalensis]
MKKQALMINRFTKFAGIFVKGFSYIYHFFLPKKRFTIPKFDPAQKDQTRKTKIPNTIWQINYTYEVSLPVYINFKFNRLLSKKWNYRHFSNDDATEFIKKNSDEETFRLYNLLNDGAAKADFFRMFVLYKFGGVYLDIDATFCLPLDKLIKSDDDELFLMTKHRFSNYFVASAPGNLYIKRTLDLILENIKNRYIKDGVYNLTGPNVLNKAIDDENSVQHRHNRYTCVQGSFTNEYFQYLDKPKGKWIYIKNDEILKKDNE